MSARGRARVVVEGAVGATWLRQFRHFRHEVHRWRDGVIPDIDDAVDSPVRLADEAGVVEDVLDLVPLVPTLVWAAMSSIQKRCGTRTR